MSNAKPTTQTKSTQVIAMLNSGKGASIDEICKATRWQKHSARSFLTGLRKKGFTITREQRGDEGSSYRITKTPEQNTEKAAS